MKLDSSPRLEVMSSFNFLEDEVSEVERAQKDLAQLDRQSGSLFKSMVILLF